MDDFPHLPVHQWATEHSLQPPIVKGTLQADPVHSASSSSAVEELEDTASPGESQAGES